MSPSVLKPTSSRTSPTAGTSGRTPTPNPVRVRLAPNSLGSFQAVPVSTNAASSNPIVRLKPYTVISRMSQRRC